MLDSQASTIDESDLSPGESHGASESFDLSGLPAIFVLPTHIGETVCESIFSQLTFAGARIAPSIADASIVVGSLTSAKRARFELQTRHVKVVDTVVARQQATNDDIVNADSQHVSMIRKRKRDNNSSYTTASPSDVSIASNAAADRPGTLKVVKLDWVHDMLAKSMVLPWQDYLVCLIITDGSALSTPEQPRSATTSGTVMKIVKSVVPQYDRPADSSGQFATSTYPGRRSKHHKRKTSAEINPALVRETTEEYEASTHRGLPEMPEWVLSEKIYACQRQTPADSPNEAFIELLKSIRLARILIEDEVGVRAYSTSIASIAAYPYKLSDAREVTMLPGCDQKIAHLFREYQATGRIVTSEVIDTDAALKVINDFYNIWGVGAKTAREFYYDRGWRDHDDIIEYGWNVLTRVQQIGLKYYEEFELKIPRDEVERIAATVAAEARKLTDHRLTCTVVGGYRRGKALSGDVDLVLSHPEEDATSFLVQSLVAQLEQSETISHTLMLSEANSARGQEAVGLKMSDTRHAGFDTLDKALVVWQDPDWSGKDAARAADPEARNPNVHRRVDIIVSPWRTVGCAIAGWSSGTTFQRDLRRWSRHKHRWKFDSSGVRDLATGRWIDLERWTDKENRAKTPEEAERRVFEGLGLPYIEPRYRCTG